MLPDELKLIRLFPTEAEDAPEITNICLGRHLYARWGDARSGRSQSENRVPHPWG
jgi:hypothetical protein